MPLPLRQLDPGQGLLSTASEQPEQGSCPQHLIPPGGR